MCVEKNTPDEIIAVVQAFKEGKEIEYNLVGSQSDERWISGDPRWNFSHCHYRVKQEPEKVEVLVYKNAQGMIGVFPFSAANEHYLRAHQQTLPHYTRVTLDVLFKPTSSL